MDQEPHQPRNLVFPKRNFGQSRIVQRSFQGSWFDSYPWLHYDEALDLVFCHICARAEKEGKLMANCKDSAFLSKGFSNWKDATEGFRRHERSKCHADAVQVIVVLPKTTRDVGETLSTIHAREKANNRRALLKILANIRYFGRQGLPLRGHDDAESNFHQLLKLQKRRDPGLAQWLERKGDKYCSPEIQNEFLKLLSLSVLRDIAENIQGADFFTVMADECADISNHEQLTVCFRWVDSQLEVHEEFIGLYAIPDITADTIVAALRDCVLRLNLNWSRCRGQCFDGASNMTGHRNGVATQITREEPRALFTHCYGHSLNLAMCDTIKGTKLLRDAMDVTYEISKLIKYSPKRNAAFDELKERIAPDTPGFRVLCPTRWTVRAKSLKSVEDNYAVLQELWSSVLDGSVDPDVRARVCGVKAQMESFNYYFGIRLGQLVLNHADNLSATLQRSSISASEGQHVAQLSVEAMEKLRNEDSFQLFWDSTIKLHASFDIADPQLPRKRKQPQRYEEESAPGFQHDAVELYYRQIYYEAIDNALSTIRSRFDQPGFQMYRQLECLLLKSFCNENVEKELTAVTSFYGSDLNATQLKVQLSLLQGKLPSSCNLKDAVSYLRTFSSAEQQVLSQVIKVVRLILVNPATNAISERSFSAMRRIKTYLRSTMGQSRLNAVMILHVHKEKTDEIQIVDIANEFAESRSSNHRRTVFGVFSSSDLE